MNIKLMIVVILCTGSLYASEEKGLKCRAVCKKVCRENESPVPGVCVSNCADRCIGKGVSSGDRSSAAFDSAKNGGCELRTNYGNPSVRIIKPEEEFMHTDGNTYKIDAAQRLYLKKTVWHERGSSTFWVSLHEQKSDNPYGEGDGGL